MFGPDVARFRPGRWLEAEGDQLQKMEDAVNTVFGSGRHRCLGRTIEFLELNKIIAEVRYLQIIIYFYSQADILGLHGFDMTIVNPVHPFSSRCNGIHLQTGIKVSVKRRGDYPMA